VNDDTALSGPVEVKLSDDEVKTAIEMAILGFKASQYGVPNGLSLLIMMGHGTDDDIKEFRGIMDANRHKSSEVIGTMKNFADKLSARMEN
jgi:hypothetical protein